MGEDRSFGSWPARDARLVAQTWLRDWPLSPPTAVNPHARHLVPPADKVQAAKVAAAVVALWPWRAPARLLRAASSACGDPQLTSPQTPVGLTMLLLRALARRHLSS